MTKELFLVQAGVYAVVVVILVTRTIVRGRALWRDFERAFPEHYEELGRPWPGWFESQRRRRHAAYLGQRRYEAVRDEVFHARFARLHGSENRAFFVLIGGLVYLGAVGWWHRDAWGV